ncbi:alcohol acetyltransferase [Aspergillus egyptiacus]|nr:alcohol acetyltransferase [Aspergillus egyptiacus]
MDKFEKLRPVGGLEKISTVRHPLKYYFNVAMSANYTIPDPYTLPLVDYIYKALETLINRHPVLSAIPLGEDTEDPYFVRLPEVDLAQPVSFRKRVQSFPEGDEQDSELESVLQEQHNTGFTAPQPYWRLIIFTDDANDKRFTAAFVFHHALGDGTSGKAFHRTFLQALRETASLKPGEAKQVITPPKTPLLPNLEAIHPLPISLLYLAKIILKELLPFGDDPKLWAAAPCQVPVKTNLRNIVFSAAETSALVKACRNHDTTVTCALQTAIARSIFAHIPEDYTRIAMAGAISCRSWLKEQISDDEMGVWVQEFAETYTRKAVAQQTFPWSEAQRSRQTIQRELKLQSKNSSVGLLRYIKDYRKQLYEPKIGKPRKYACEVSSLGVVKTENAQDAALPQIGRVVFSQSSSATGCAIQLSVVTGVDGCLAVAVSFQEGVVDEGLMGKILGRFKEEVRELCA